MVSVSSPPPRVPTTTPTISSTNSNPRIAYAVFIALSYQTSSFHKILESFGAEEETALRFGGLVGGIIPFIDFTPIGRGARTISGAVRIIKNTSTPDRAFTALKNLGFTDDVARREAESLFTETNRARIKARLTQLSKEQNTEAALRVGQATARITDEVAVQDVLQQTGKSEKEARQLAPEVARETDPIEIARKVAGESFDEDVARTVQAERKKGNIFQTGVPSGRSFSSISTPSETSSLLRALSSQVRVSRSSILVALSDPTLQNLSSVRKYLTEVDFVAIADSLYQSAGRKASDFIGLLQRAGFRSASIDIKKPASLLLKSLRKNKRPDDLNDFVRGTVVVSTEVEAARIVDTLGDAVVKADNFFKNPRGPYRGINVDVRLPDGSLAELQIHTPKSLAKADRIHQVYDKSKLKEIEEIPGVPRAEQRAGTRILTPEGRRFVERAEEAAADQGFDTVSEIEDMVKAPVRTGNETPSMQRVASEQGYNTQPIRKDGVEVGEIAGQGKFNRDTTQAIRSQTSSFHKILESGIILK